MAGPIHGGPIHVPIQFRYIVAGQGKLYVVVDLGVAPYAIVWVGLDYIAAMETAQALEDQDGS